MTRERKFQSIITTNANFIFFSAFISIFLVYIWKAQYGYGLIDEHFFVQLADRFARGGKMIVDEWGIQQLMAFFTLPLVKLFQAITGSNEGIILYMRIVYLIFHALVSASIFKILKRKYILSGMFASLLYFVFIPSFTMQLSYNSMAIDFFVLSILYLFMNDFGSLDRLKYKIHIVLSGLFFACSVMNAPFFAGYYFLVTLGLFCILKKKRSTYINVWIYFTMGIVLQIVFFLIYLIFQTSSINVLIENIKYIKSISTYAITLESVINTIYYKGSRIFELYGGYYFGAFLILIFAAISKINIKIKLNLLVILTILGIVYIIDVVLINPMFSNEYGYTFIFIFFIFIDFYLLLYIEMRISKYILFFTLISTLFLSFSFLVSSDTIISFTYPLVVFLLVFPLLILESQVCEEKIIGVSVRMVFSGISICLILIIATLNCLYVYGACILQLNNKIHTNSLKGLVVSNLESLEYSKSQEDIEYINSHVSGNILLITNNIYLYLDSKNNIYAPSSFPSYYDKKPYLLAINTYFIAKPSTVSTYLYIDDINRVNLTQDDFQNITSIKRLKKGSLYKFK